MNDERLAELKEKYKDRNLFEELAWGAYADHSGYTSKQNGEFLNWLCMRAYKALKERPQGEWIKGREISRTMIGDKVQHINYKDYTCSNCGLVLDKLLYWDDGSPFYKFCPECGADMRGGRE